MISYGWCPKLNRVSGVKLGDRHERIRAQDRQDREREDEGKTRS